MYRFLLRPRWIAGVLLILLAAATMVWLGTWQLDRMHLKRATNAAITAAAEAPVAQANELIPAASDQRPAIKDQWRTVTMTGTYLESSTVLVRQRTFSLGVGVEVLVPLQADDGRVYLISRGFVPSADRADELPDIPAPPKGEVTVTGWLRVPYNASSTATNVVMVDGQRTVRALNVPIVAEAVDLPLAGGYIAATEETGADAAAITRVPLPELDDGPHLSYAVQWFIFAGLTLGFLVYLVRREAITLLLQEYAEDGNDDDPPAEPHAHSVTSTASTR